MFWRRTHSVVLQKLLYVSCNTNLCQLLGYHTKALDHTQAGVPVFTASAHRRISLR